MSCFSALQRAENSSIDVEYRACSWLAQFQCSSASRKFLNMECSEILRLAKETVSVLFSEPKIPQSFEPKNTTTVYLGFSALQRAENSSIHC